MIRVQLIIERQVKDILIKSMNLQYLSNFDNIFNSLIVWGHRKCMDTGC